MKIKKKCTKCGSTDVRIDAWGAWNEETQEWELAEIYQAVFCFGCDGESMIKDEKIKNPLICPNNCKDKADGKYYDCPVCPRIWHPKFEDEETPDG